MGVHKCFLEDDAIGIGYYGQILYQLGLDYYF